MTRRLLIFFGIFICIVAATILMQFAAYKNRPIVLQDGLLVKIPPGQSVRSLLKSLSLNANIESFSPLWFEFFIRVQGHSREIQAGEYELSANLTGQTFVRKIVEGDVRQHALTILEGWTFAQALSAIQKHPKIEVTLTEPDSATLAQTLKLDSPSVEGWIFPETYYFPKGTTDLQFIQRAVKLMQEKLQSAWEVKSEGIHLKSPYELLILASIIERESSLAHEFPVVSQVFHNRLIKKMKLQADPTVIYGLGAAFEGDLRKADLKYDSPYNTYVYKGLPPTPIANPSFGALLAAAKPANGDYYYFVAKGDGTHHFSKDLDEHQKMVNKYQRKINND